MPKHLMEDELNQRILSILLEDGRCSHAQLAERLGVSRPTIIERIKRLEAEDIISGYTIRVRPAAVQKPTVAFVSVRFPGIEPDRIEHRLLEALRLEPDILEAHTVAGEDCLLLKVIAKTPQDISERLRRIRSLAPNVSTRTTIVLESHFEKPGPDPVVEPSHGKSTRS